MNHYAAREIADADGKSTGRWRYTLANKRTGIYAIGYCANGCEGHATAEEACEHYKSYLLDTQLDLDGVQTATQERCLVCNAWTQGVAYIDHRLTRYVLCDEHRTREEVAARFSVGEAWGTL